MRNYYDSVKNAFKQRHSLIIIGLTGRTGSGCSTTAEILKAESFEALHLKEPKKRDFQSRNERKYEVVYKYMQAENHWKPFSIISGSNIIFSFILESGFKEFQDFIAKFKSISPENDVRISAFDEVKKIVNGMEHLFRDQPLCNIEKYLNALQSEPENGESKTEEEKYQKKVEECYDFYLNKLPKLKKEFYDALSEYTCHKEYVKRFKQTKFVKSHLYTYLMQEIGNNIRCSGSPYSREYNGEHFYDVAKRMEEVIKIIKKHNENVDKSQPPQTRICIDAIRNPYEAYYFKDKYSSFYLISLNTEEDARKKRLGQLDEEELQSLDEIEYEVASQSDYGIFYHQTIPECLKISDIHLYNPDICDNRFFFLTEQILKYIALILHPGLVNPTHVERCMQTAYIASLNSGCLSRQVGAAITGPDFSVKAIGWNEVPEGQISCNLRCTRDYCKSKDPETYSHFELENERFQEALIAIDQAVSQCDHPDLGGMTYSYCFKDIYNELEGGIKNQVFTRALHAEENAFLQLSKNGGQGIKGGKLFSTDSPCELCSKKAYQLGIKEIYYIDPYPGISAQHILNFGRYGNPIVHLFYGAIGNAYVKLYSPRFSIKDELKLRTGVDCKKVVKNLDAGTTHTPGIKDIKYINQECHFIFNSRTNVTECTKLTIQALRDGIDQVTHHAYWTGSSFDGFSIKSCDKKCHHKNIQGKKLPYMSILTFDSALKKDETATWELQTDAKDTRCIMSPYYAQIVTFKTEKLKLIISAPKGMLTNVEKVVYADTKMSKDLEVSRALLPSESDEKGERFVFNVDAPNLMYSYSIEWIFNDLGNSNAQ